MLKSRRNFRLGLCGAVLGAVYLGLAGSAMAWNEPLWVRQLGTEVYDSASGVTTDAAGNVYLSGTRYAHKTAAWVAKYDAAGHVLWKRRLKTASGRTLTRRSSRWTSSRPIRSGARQKFAVQKDCRNHVRVRELWSASSLVRMSVFAPSSPPPMISKATSKMSIST